MAASRGWVPVFVLAVTTLTVCGEACKVEESLLNACQFVPNVCRAVSMNCNFSDILSSPIIGHLPPSLQEIRIRHSSEINITGNMFSHLNSLKSIYLSGIGTLRINNNNWTRIKQPEQVTITMDSVTDLSLLRGAFSGWLDPGPKIIIRNVTRCHISYLAFSRDSDIQSVVLQNIQDLTLDRGAFDATIGQLELVNVSQVTGCRLGSFCGRIRTVSLRSVNITEVSSGCLSGWRGWDSLTIRSSYLGNIRPRGIYGRFNNVVIEDSRLGHVSSAGLSLFTSTFTMKSTVVEELSADALGVRFDQSASLQRLTINSLRANAFRLLGPDAGATLTIEQVSVGKAEDSSLAFSNQTQVSLLDVQLRDPCQCDVDKWALRLMVEDATTSNATDEQQSAVRQIVNQVRCRAGSAKMTMLNFHCRSCSVQGEDTARCPPLVSQTYGRGDIYVVADAAGADAAADADADAADADASDADAADTNAADADAADADEADADAVDADAVDAVSHDDDDHDWTMAVGVGTPLLVLVLAGAVVTLVKRRRSRQREEHPPADQLRSNRNTQDVTPEPVYCEIPEYVEPEYSEIPEYVQPDRRNTSSAFGEPLSTDHPHAVPSDPENSNVDAQVLPRPPSPLYLEMTPRSARIPDQSVDMNCDAVAADKQQPLDVNCGARKGGERGELEYDKLVHV